MLFNDYTVWETPQDESLDSSFPGEPRHSYEWNHVLFKDIECRFNGILKLRAKPQPFLFVPERGLSGFFCSAVVDPDNATQPETNR